MACRPEPCLASSSLGALALALVVAAPPAFLLAVGCTRAAPASSEGARDAMALDDAAAAKADAASDVPGAGPPGSAAPSSPSSVSSAAAPTAPSTTATASAATVEAPEPLRSSDASAAYCRTVRGPIELPLKGPAALVMHADRIDAVLDDDGRPHVASFSLAAQPGSPPAARESLEGGAGRGLHIPCATAGDFAFCPDRSGAVHRARLTGEEDRIVASSRTGTRVAAAMLAGTHVALAYVASRTTSEGWVSEAWLAVDDEPPLRFSEDGSGATAAELVVRGGSLLALGVDARIALTALHARPITYDHGARLGEDAVVFVGGPGDRRTGLAAVVPPSGPAWALLPIARDITAFGLATVRLDDPPRVDEPVVWSMYPNGLDPAPVAAIVRGTRTWAARVRPQTAAPGAPHVLELGEIAADGGFTARDTIPTGDAPTEVTMATLGTGGGSGGMMGGVGVPVAGAGASASAGDLWITWADASGSWLERLHCP
jgi:hypothetical protein